MKHCTVCGSKLPQPNPKHCPECGAAIAAGADVPKSAAVANAAVQPSGRDQVIKVLSIFFGVLLGCLLIGIIQYPDLFFGSESIPSVVPTMSPTVSPSPAPGGLLAGATFYKGPRPEPEQVSYFDGSGNNITVLALPGELLVSAPANAKRADVDKALSATGVKYKVLAAIPAVGSYLIEVNPGFEAYFISTLRLLGNGYFAAPNFVFSVGDAPPVDLTDTGKTLVVDPSRLVDFTSDGIPECGEALYVPAFLGSPDPSAMAITALIDNFEREDPSKPSHGENTEAALRANCGGCPMLKLDLGSNHVAGDEIERALAAAVASAEINGQDVVVSLSFGPATMFNAASSLDMLDYANDAARNARAGRDWETFMKELLNVLGNSDWARSGHVRLHKSAGNGALLCDPPAAGEALCSDDNKIRNDTGVNLTQPMNDLLSDPFYGPLMRDDVKVWCAYEHGTSSLASYSNYGPSIACKEPYGSLEGTSFSAPIGAGNDFLAVRQRLGRGPPTAKVFPSPMPTCPVNVSVTPTLGVTPTPTLSTTISPARGVSGTWIGSASFTEDNIFTQEDSGEVLCSFSGTFTLDLVQNGNTIIGYLNKGSSATWSSYLFQISEHSSSLLSSTGLVPVIGCWYPEGGVWDEGLDSGTVSSSSIQLSTHGRPTFSGSFTSDHMSLSLVNCLMQAGQSCTVVDGAKWKITLVKQPN